MERSTDAQMGDEDGVEAVFGTGCFEDGVVAAVRGESADDPRLGGDGSVGAGSVGGRDPVLTAAAAAISMAIRKHPPVEYEMNYYWFRESSLKMAGLN